MKSTQTFSTRFLLISFLIALPIFMLMRWDSNAWLTKQVTQAATSAGYTLQYDKVSLSGLGIFFENIQVSQPNKNSLTLDSLHASLSLSNLFSGVLAADVDALWKNNAITFITFQDGEFINITDFVALVDLVQLENLLEKMPAKISGIVEIQGNLSFNTQTNQPKTGEMDITWNNAMAGLATPEFALGDYQFHLASIEDTTQPWAWNVSGGTAVALNGNGTINPKHPNPQQWDFDGNVSIQADNSNPSLAMMVQAVSGSSQANIRLSGTFARPRTEIIR